MRTRSVIPAQAGTQVTETQVAIDKQDLVAGFTKRYGVHLLVYYEMHDCMGVAIKREKQIKK